MKKDYTLWRVSFTRNFGEHAGFEWFTTPTKALQAAVAWRASGEGNGTAARSPELFSIKGTKVGIVKFLNSWASYPDNG